VKDIESKLTDFADGITAIDTDYVRPRLAASHLVVHDGRAAFVDTGTTRSVPNLMAALEARDVAAGSVDWVLTTHVHLDHAGGAGELMRHLPNARCVVHPSATTSCTETSCRSRRAACSCPETVSRSGSDGVRSS